NLTRSLFRLVLRAASHHFVLAGHRCATLVVFAFVKSFVYLGKLSK
ncbi:unnamed protein product, partial [Callosobruchus maculatus]